MDTRQLDTQPPWSIEFLDQPCLQPYADTLTLLKHLRTFPEVVTLNEQFGSLLPVGMVFVEQAQAGQRAVRRYGRRHQAARHYVQKIVNEGCIPTRRGSWHDLLNAVTWAQYGEAKLTLYQEMAAAYASNPIQRPPYVDGATMFDEGGVLLISPVPMPNGYLEVLKSRDDRAKVELCERAQVVIFGHGLLEIMLHSAQPIFAMTLVIENAKNVTAAMIADIFRSTDLANRQEIGSVPVHHLVSNLAHSPGSKTKVACQVRAR